MVLEQNLSLVNKIDRLLRWGHWFTFFNILLALVVTGSYFLADPLPQSVLGWAYLLVTWLGHTAFLCFLFFIITIFPVSLIFPYQRHVRGLAAVLATCGFVALIFDAYVYHSLGYHAGSASYEQTLDLLRQQVVTNLRNFVLITAAVGTLLLSVQLVLSNFCWKKIARLSHSGSGKPALVILLGCFVLSHLLHIWGDASQNDTITRQDNILPLSYPATARTMLARYNLLDNSATAITASGLQQNWLAPDALRQKPVQLSCAAVANTAPLHVLVLPALTSVQQQQLKQLGLRRMETHFAPVAADQALNNLLYADMAPNKPAEQPTWLSQLPEAYVAFEATASWQQQLPWLSTYSDNKALLHWHFLDKDTDLTTRVQQAAEGTVLVLELSGHSDKFALGAAAFWYRWPQLQHQRISDVTQHLDILPTLLAELGCFNQQNWTGDNLLQPQSQTKLNIVNNQLYSFRKDKMLLVEEDGSFSVWSAGTAVRLEQRLDVPMLTDALKRLPSQ
ncbi:DUF3413 domain-containing protein [Rheinheimera sp. 4Y26]|uniref:DUF3413 domain-containing protein n=1 Tax=Rheinheimera sp. 4Y26 TaxID=2977811 RepID=UPI0021B1303C|nr:DUF3413 domain-containing protein [Rheinheimera sp. 4Y26]MCT6699628.1 DUF3413 domain-containing protein [Rheinheimera sp. 4Y26]